MPITLEALQDDLLDALTDSILAAWTPLRVHRSEPETEGKISPDGLPIAYISLDDVAPDDTFPVGRCRVSARHRITLALRFLKEPGGASPVEQKRAQAEALRVLLTDGSTYAGMNRRWVSDIYRSPDAAEAEREAASRWAIVRLVFDFWIDTEGL